MKKILLSLLFIGCLFCNAQINPQVGDKLIYAVNAGGNKYNFTIVIKSMMPNFSFAWQMTNENQSYGKITIPASAMANSHKLHNYFSTGDATLNGTTSVVLSRETFKKLTTTKTAEVMDRSKKLVLSNDGQDGFSYNQEGDEKYLKALYMSTPENYQMVILNDPKFPLILSMEIGWSIRLTDYVPVTKKSLNLADFIHKNITDPTSAALWQKVDRTSLIDKEDLSVADTDKKSVYLTYYAYAEGLKVETHNDTVTKILYYPTELYHQDRKYYGANFTIPQVKNFSLARAQQKRAVTEKFKETTQYGSDDYLLKNKVSMELYYHVPKQGREGWQFGIGGDGTPATQKVGFVSFE